MRSKAGIIIIITVFIILSIVQVRLRAFGMYDVFAWSETVYRYTRPRGVGITIPRARLSYCSVDLLSKNCRKAFHV